MKIPEPKVGSVIRYSYLWLDEAAAGKQDGRKDRPALVLALALHHENGVTEVLALAITHSHPRAKGDAIEIPEAIRRQLHFDDEPAWIVTTEANAFFWPGPDLRPVPARKPPSPIYGEVPAALLKIVAQSYLTNRKRQNKLVKRET